jgi:hypothetical protein
MAFLKHYAKRNHASFTGICLVERNANWLSPSACCSEVAEQLLITIFSNAYYSQDAARTDFPTFLSAVLVLYQHCVFAVLALNLSFRMLTNTMFSQLKLTKLFVWFHIAT